jgi:hypothetical protein
MTRPLKRSIIECRNNAKLADIVGARRAAKAYRRLERLLIKRRNETNNPSTPSVLVTE